MPATHRIRLALTTLGIALLLALSTDYALYRIVFAAPAHDQSWLLYAASLVLHGTVLYGPHLTESNPPLIIWLNLLPAWLSDRTRLDPLLCLRLCVTALALASTTVCVSLLRTAGLVRNAATILLAATGLLAIEVALGDTDFAQKEQLLVLLLLPYLFSRLVPSLALPRWQRFALALAAGLGLCLKPHQWLSLVGFELTLLFARRRTWFRPELIALALVPCAYLLAVAVFARQYLTVTVPLLRDTYWAYGQGRFVTLLVNSPWYDAGVALALVLWLLLRRPLAPIALLAASGGAAVAYALQGNGWNYHFYPQKALLFCALGWFTLEWLVGRRARWRAASAAGLVGAVVLGAICLPIGTRQAERKAHDQDDLRQAFAQLRPGTPVYILSTNLVGFEQVTDAHLVWGSRYAHLWMLPAIVQGEAGAANGLVVRKSLTASRISQLAELQRTSVAEDLGYWKPAIMAVKRCSPHDPCQGLEGMSFDPIDWFDHSAEFHKQWQAYHLAQHGSHYDIYRRDDSLGTVP